MAGDWIKFEKTTLEKPEVFELSEILGIDPDAVVGKLLRVWNWFDDHSRDGNAHVTVTALLDRYTGVTGFVRAMQQVGWMTLEGVTITIPRFDRHNGTPAKTRALGRVRTQNHRANDENAECNAGCNDPSVTDPLQDRYKVVTREEKRREEKQIEEEKKEKRPRVPRASANRATLSELESYSAELGMPATDGAYMFDRWEANGWRNGRDAVKDWKAGFRTYKASGWLPSQKQANGYRKPPTSPDRLPNGECTIEAHERGF